MYNQEADLKQNAQTTTGQQTLLVNVKNELTERNQEQCKLIYEIEEKLHTVVNKRQGEEVAIKSESPNINDFSQDIGLQLSLMKNNTRRLSSILNHLSEII